MRIVHLNTHDSGGSWIYARSISDALCEAGHDSVVRCRDLTDRPLSDKFLRRASLAMTRGAWHGTRRTLPPPPPEWIDAADVVHLHTMADWFDVPQWLRTLPRHIRLIVGLHDLWHISGGCFVYGNCDRFRTNCSPCPLLRAPVHQVFACNELQRKARAYQSADARFVANSQWLRETAMDSPVLRGREIRVVPPPVDPAVFHQQDRVACRARFNIGMDDPVVATGCASLTDTNKDTPGLLRILADLNLPRLKVLMFGDGEISVPDGLDVRPLGPIHGKRELATIYGAADLFASASRMETYGLTLAEAFACGCAVVAHDAGGIPEAVPNDPTVVLVPLNDRSAFIEAVRDILHRSANRSSRVRTERAAPRAASPNHAAELLAEIYSAP